MSSDLVIGEGIGEVKGLIKGINQRFDDLSIHNTNQHKDIFEQLKKIGEKQVETETTMTFLATAIEKDRVGYNEMKQDLLEDIDELKKGHQFFGKIMDFISTPLGRRLLYILIFLLLSLFGVSSIQDIKDFVKDSLKD